MSEHILTDLENGILTVRLSRAVKKNALTAEMYSALAAALDRAGQNGDVSVVLLAGSEGVFTAGNDLEDFLRNPPKGADAPVFRFIAGLVGTDVPLVAAVDGVAVGIGTTLLLHCDYVVASDRSRFSLPFINLALVPEAGSSMLLVEACGYRKAAELLMFGEPFSADRALDCGIVSRICAPGDVMERAREAAALLAAKPRGALRATKRLLRRAREPMADRVRAEGLLFGECLESPEAKEAFRAFLEKRAPDFSRFA
jgi:enoyl-CoA hydratase/carnithine racemase